jgi:hypothetical protein
MCWRPPTSKPFSSWRRSGSRFRGLRHPRRIASTRGGAGGDPGPIGVPGPHERGARHRNRRGPPC